MSVGWKAATRLADKNSYWDGDYIRLPQDGSEIVAAFSGEAFVKEVVWIENHFERYDPNDHRDKTPSLRVLLNLYLPKENSMAVFEGTAAWFFDVAMLRATHPFDEWLFSIKRHGKPGSKNTRYSVQPFARLTSEQRDEIQQLRPIDLALLSGAKSKQSQREKKEPNVDPFEL